MPDKLSVAILYGGRSVEHGVSINSAKNIFEYIDRNRFEPLLIGITTDGQWFLTRGVSKDIDQGQPLGLVLNPAKPGFIVLENGNSLKPDIIFPVLHGTDGEDGSIQGLIRTMDIPMVGTGVLGSAVSMNKIVAKRLLNAAGIPVTRFQAYHFEERSSISYEKIVSELGSPVMVKSASLGSSVGVTKANDEAGFKKAVEEAFRYDNQLIVEEFIKGREIECAILGNNPPNASNPGEIIISDKYEFYTFDAKYVDGEAVKINVPARLTPHEIEKIRNISVRTFQVLHGEDFARVDLFVTEDGRIYVNEINTIPGFTNSSMYPMMWQERGISFTDLISKLIKIAMERYAQNTRVERGFVSALKY